jgi:hypothetical protein
MDLMRRHIEEQNVFTTLPQLCQERKTPYNSTYPKGGVSCSADSFVVAESLVLRMKFGGKNPALRVAAKRYMPF